jgi:hypothetical protein
MLTGNVPRRPDGTFEKTRLILWDESRWDDGFKDDETGKVHVYRPDFPGSTKAGWAHRARVVWWLHTGQVSTTKTPVHHINEIPDDDRFENLEMITAQEHARIHCSKPLIACVCLQCGDTFYLPQWRINEGKGDWCSLRCYWNAGGKYARRRMENSNA